MCTAAHKEKEEFQSIALWGRLGIGPKTRLRSEVFEDSTVVPVPNDVPEPSGQLNSVLQLLRKMTKSIFEKDFHCEIILC